MSMGRWLALITFLSLSPFSASARDLPTDLAGQSVDPFAAAKADVMVFVFLAEECPIANRYAPRISRYANTYGAQGVSFWTVYADQELSVERIRQHRSDYAFEMPALWDRGKWLVAKTGAQVTPEVAVYRRKTSGSYELAYLGRIDDQYLDFGQWRREPQQKDMEEVLDALLQGESPTFRKTRAVGCYIGD
ncbi:redoxin domain-containing protein [Opitutaceae bacterium]|nr:redoxin domain-containing protein [Opitutaceae bacterium]